MENIISKLKDLINKRGYTISSFAKEIGVDRGALTHVLSGRNKPSLAIIKAVVDRFDDMSFDYLIYDQEPSSPSEPIPLNFETKKDSGSNNSQVLNTVEEPKSLAPIQDEITNKAHQEHKLKQDCVSKSVTKVILVYSDGSIDIKE